MDPQLLSRYLLPALLFISFFSKMQCYKILLYTPTMAHSHVNFFGRIADILVEAGHDVVMYMPELDPDIKTNGTKLARIIKPALRLSTPFSMTKIAQDTWTENMEDFLTMFKLIAEFKDMMGEFMSVQLGDEAAMEQLRAEHFDFALNELFNPCGYAVFRKIGLKNYATAFPTGLPEAVSDPLGASSNPSYVPAITGSTGDVMNYWERIQNVFSYMTMYLIGFAWRLMANSAEFMKYTPDGFDFLEAIRKSSLAFVNSEELLEFPRLISHKIVFIGGIAVDKPKPLNEEYQKIMNKSTNGVVLVAFGSIARSRNTPLHIKKSFREAFRSFPEVTFIWKYEENDDFAADLSNVIKKKWVPQLDLLGHPNLRAFVSHCGQNSLTESVNEGVPLICIPLFGDQNHNAAVVVKRNIGIHLNKYNVSSDTLKDAFYRILHDNRYRQASRRLQEMIRNKPISARERLLRHIDFAAKFGPIDNFDVAYNDLSFIQYYLLDIIIPFLLVLALIVYLILRLILCILYKLLSLTKLKTE